MQREKLRFLPLGAPPPSHTLPGFYHSRLPGARLRAVTRNSLTLHPKARLVRGSGDGGVWTLFSAVRKAALALRAPRPAGDSLGSTTARCSGASTARARFSVADSDPNLPSPPHSDERINLPPSCRSRRPRSKATASGNQTDTITTHTSQKPLRPGPGPKTRKQIPSSFAALQRQRRRPMGSRQSGSRRDDNKGRGRNGPGGGHLKSVL